MDYWKLVNNIYHIKVVEIWKSNAGTEFMKIIFLDGVSRGEIFSIPIPKPNKPAKPTVE